MKQYVVPHGLRPETLRHPCEDLIYLRLASALIRKSGSKESLPILDAGSTLNPGITSAPGFDHCHLKPPERIISGPQFLANRLNATGSKGFVVFPTDIRPTLDDEFLLIEQDYAHITLMKLQATELLEQKCDEVRQLRAILHAQRTCPHALQDRLDGNLTAQSNQLLNELLLGLSYILQGVSPFLKAGISYNESPITSRLYTNGV